MVKIPPGVKEGQKIRLAKMGNPGKNGGTAGDLYLKISIEKTFFESLILFVSRFKSMFSYTK